MNEKTFKKIRDLKRQINFNSLSGNKENMVSLNLNEGSDHLSKKIEVCMELINKGYSIWTEVIFVDSGCRGDVVGISKEGNGLIVEIINTESKESLEKKKSKYPSDFEFIEVYVDKPLELPL